MVDSLTNAVLVITLFQLLVLAAVLFRQKSGKLLSRNFLIIFLLTKAFLITRWSVFKFGLLQYQDQLVFYQLSSAFFLLLAPILYFYIKSICIKNINFKRNDVIHALPFLGLFIFKGLLVYNYFSDNVLHNSALINFLFTNHWAVFWFVNLVQIFIYILLMIQVFKQYQNNFQAINTNGNKANLNWLKSLIFLISLHWLFISSRSTLALLDFQLQIVIKLLDLFSISIFLGFTTYLVIKGLNQLKLLNGVQEKSKYANSVLTENALKKYAHELSQFMNTQKPYLDPSVTLEELAQKLSIPGWQLSQVINEYYNQNFFNYINSHRIEEAKQLLSRSDNGKKTVLQILYEVGFNSKSTFNSAFKKHTGITPSQYKDLN